MQCFLFILQDVQHTMSLLCQLDVWKDILSDIDGVSNMLANGVSFLNRSKIKSGQAGLYTCKACVADSCDTQNTTITVQCK